MPTTLIDKFVFRISVRLQLRFVVFKKQKRLAVNKVLRSQNRDKIVQLIIYQATTNSHVSKMKQRKNVAWDVN